jgi:hypothetical protein
MNWRSSNAISVSDPVSSLSWNWRPSSWKYIRWFGFDGTYCFYLRWWPPSVRFFYGLASGCTPHVGARWYWFVRPRIVPGNANRCGSAEVREKACHWLLIHIFNACRWLRVLVVMRCRHWWAIFAFRMLAFGHLSCNCFGLRTEFVFLAFFDRNSRERRRCSWKL